MDHQPPVMQIERVYDVRPGTKITVLQDGREMGEIVTPQGVVRFRVQVRGYGPRKGEK